jgi:prophage antirepressor-like protein
MDIQVVQNNLWKFDYILVDGDPWFKGKEVATLLGYMCTAQAIRDHVDAEDKKRLEELGVVSDTTLSYNDRQGIYINEPGLYMLLDKCGKPEADAFKRWIYKKVVPSIRKYGKYDATEEAVLLPALTDTNLTYLKNKGLYDDEMIKRRHEIRIKDREDELHNKVVEWIRRFHPNIRIDSFLGEMQVHQVDDLRSDRRLEAYRKGYSKGACDLIITDIHRRYKGVCVEFKNPNATGSLRPQQADWLADKHRQGFHVIISNDYDNIIRQLSEYISDIRFKCDLCNRCFISPATREKHLLKFHRVRRQNQLAIVAGE